MGCMGVCTREHMNMGTVGMLRGGLVNIRHVHCTNSSRITCCPLSRKLTPPSGSSSLCQAWLSACAGPPNTTQLLWHRGLAALEEAKHGRLQEALYPRHEATTCCSKHRVLLAHVHALLHALHDHPVSDAPDLQVALKIMGVCGGICMGASMGAWHGKRMRMCMCMCMCMGEGRCTGCLHG